MSRFPDFLNIGMRKADTSWLHEILARHLNLELPPAEKPVYYDKAYISAHRQAPTKHFYMNTYSDAWAIKLSDVGADQLNATHGF